MKTIDKLIIMTVFISIVVIIPQLVNPFIVNAAFYCSGSDCWYMACNKNSDCGTNGFTGEYTCQGNNLYQEYITYNCNNLRSANSSCASTKGPQLVQTCGSNQKCQTGLWFAGCASTTNTIDTNTKTTNNFYNQNINYTSRSIKGCINNSVYWYDSLGNQQGLYQNCGITGQTCYDGQCIGQLQAQSKPQPVKQSTLEPSYKTSKNLIVSIFGKKESEPLQWGKNVNAVNSDKIEFLLTVKNTSNLPMDNISVKVDITKNIRYTNNLKIDDVASDKNIVSGINLATIPQNTSKALSFTGVFQSQNTTKEGLKIIGTVTADNISDSDFFTISSNPTAQVQNKINPNTAAIGNYSIFNSVKKWYFWIIITIILIILFIVIFKRISSKV